MTPLNFTIYILVNSLILSSIPLLVPVLGWDWMPVYLFAGLMVALAIAVSRTLWIKYSVRLFWLWLSFVGALFGAYGANVFNYFLRN